MKRGTVDRIGAQSTTMAFVALMAWLVHPDMAYLAIVGAVSALLCALVWSLMGEGA
jgi:hypothetical protein